jgi:hypothetical protein
MNPEPSDGGTMDEEKVRALARAEIVAALQLVSDAASDRTGYGCGELESSAAYVVIGAMSSAVSGLTPAEPESCTQHEYRYFGPHSGSRCVSCNKPIPGQTEPEPVNPFAHDSIAEVSAQMFGRGLPDSTALVQATLDAGGLLPQGVYKVSGQINVPATEPEPENPFSPKRTPQQWAVILRSTIDAAEKDGHDVWINNDCCGCSRMTLEVGSGTEHVRVIGDSQ